MLSIWLSSSQGSAVDKTALLHILGRDNDVINIGGYKVIPEEIEM